MNNDQLFHEIGVGEFINTFIELAQSKRATTLELEVLLDDLKKRYVKGDHRWEACVALGFAKHKWNGGKFVFRFLSSANFIGGLIQYSEFLKRLENSNEDVDVDVDVDDIIDLYVDFIEKYLPIIPANEVTEMLKNKSDDKIYKIKPIFKTSVLRTVAPRVNTLKLLDRSAMNINDFTFDIIRYYQRYSPPFQEPFQEPSTMNKVQRSLITHLDELFTKLPPIKRETIFYRGVISTSIDKFTTVSNSYKSTSANISTALEFLGQKTCCLLSLAVDVGVPMLSINVRPDIFIENEYLLPRNAYFKRDPSGDIDIDVKMGTNTTMHVYHFKVYLDPNFNFKDIENIPLKKSIAESALNLQDDGSFLNYARINYSVINNQILTPSQLIYDYFTRKINVMLYNDMFYDEIIPKLEAIVNNVKNNLIVLLYTNDFQNNEVIEMINIMEDFDVNSILNGVMYHVPTEWISDEYIQHDD